MKKGMQLAIGTIILIILGIMILIGLLFMLNKQTGFFSSFLKNSGESNVDVVISMCNSLVDSGNSYAYCCEKKKIVFVDKELELTCFEFSQLEGFEDRVKILDCSSLSC